MARTVTILALAAASAAAAAPVVHAAPGAHLHRRWGCGTGVFPYGGFGGVYPYGGYGGFGGYGYGGFFPFASSVTNDFGANSNFAHFNDDTLYVNNQDATVANNNVHSFNNANVVA
ncbi:hypothetical protein H4R18_005252 [Coemansia javaensis]|uniref:Uncharacterized protein n=1 Tax=Coemansia javaensis TaxID=2761396 RepID=A0A9W8H957_9FUNG|nr:hypothetical protein H4R18_005252 [Coemansia javaensis]